MSAHDALVHLLAGVPILAGAPAGALERLARSARTQRLAAGEQLFAAGDPPDNLAVVVAGRVAVLADRDGTPVLLRHVGRGGAVGELSLLTGEPRSAAVVARRDTVLAVVDGHDFDALLARQPTVARSLARVLAGEVQRAVPHLASPAAGATLRPATLTLVAADAGAPVHRLLERLPAALGPSVHHTVFDREAAQGEGDAARPGRWQRRWVERLDQLEATHELVVLPVVDPSRSPGWAAFALRAADRILVVAGGGDPRLSSPLLGDLVGVDLLDARGGAGRSVCLLPHTWRARHLVPSGRGFEAAADRALRRVTGRAVGLVLSGGGARGLAHLGVIEGLNAAGVRIDRFGGCSMGALVAAMAAQDWPPATCLAVAREELVDHHPFTDWTVPRASLIRGRRAARMLERVFGDRVLEDLPFSTFALSADLHSGQRVVHRDGPLVTAVGASMSIPGFAPPLADGERLLVDGGLLDNLPVGVMADDGEGPIIAVDVMRRLGTAVVAEERSGRRRHRDPGDGFTSIVDTLARSMTLGAAETAARNRDRADLLLSPAVSQLSLLDFDRFAEAVEAGRSAVARADERGLLDPFRRH